MHDLYVFESESVIFLFSLLVFNYFFTKLYGCFHSYFLNFRFCRKKSFMNRKRNTSGSTCRIRHYRKTKTNRRLATLACCCFLVCQSCFLLRKASISSRVNVFMVRLYIFQNVKVKTGHQQHSHRFHLTLMCASQLQLTEQQCCLTVS